MVVRNPSQVDCRWSARLLQWDSLLLPCLVNTIHQDEGLLQITLFQYDVCSNSYHIFARYPCSHIYIFFWRLVTWTLSTLISKVALIYAYFRFCDHACITFFHYSYISTTVTETVGIQQLFNALMILCFVGVCGNALVGVYGVLFPFF